MPELVIDTPERLQSLFGVPGEASVRKEVPTLHPAYQAMIAASPFMVLATAGAGGLDASPRGDPAGFVQVQDERTLLIPERRGNNRIDSLRNLLDDPRVALLFLIPGRGETLRVNGHARILATPELLQRFAVNGALPRCVIEVSVQTVYFQCARAILRSRLWDASTHAAAAGVPTPGAILEQLTGSAIDGVAYDRELPGRQQSTLY